MIDFLSGYNFARQSDVVFSETILENGSLKTYIVNTFELNDSDIIFCKTDNVLKLFEILEDENELKNLKLITHESDYEINQKLFELKPSCISKWYGININYNHSDLIPIPLGLANDYCPITLKYNDICEAKENRLPQKLLYINHRFNTNIEKRKWIYNFFQNNDWCSIDYPNLSFEEYKIQLNKHHFIICPQGNGIDTHRLWESLYCGIIPIVENHIHNKCLENLPVIIVGTYKEVTKDFLEEKIQKISKIKFNFNKLNTSWWINQIKTNEL